MNGHWSAFAVVFPVAIAWAIFTSAGGVRGQEAVKNGAASQVKAPISFRVERWGINMLGELTTIEPSGSWTFVRFYLDKDGHEKIQDGRCGRLTPEQMTSLGKVMEAQDFRRWPARIGVQPKVNANRYLIKQGSKETVLAGISTRPGQKVSEKIFQAARAPGKSDSEAWKRFAAVVAEIETLTKPKAE